MRDVAFSCDDNGAKFLRVTVWSLLKHYKGDEPLRINVFEGFGGHSAESKSKMEALVEEWNRKGNFHCTTTTPRIAPATQLASLGGYSDYDFFSVRYINVEKAIEPYADLIMNREKSRWNVFTWTPIFTPFLLNDATGNVAHFDIDMLFNDDVSKILDLDLGENLIAAVAEYGKGDPVITEAVWGKGILPSEAERYFNTGTIVFNTAKCREEKTWERILAWYRDHYDIADRIEQDAWNALYWKRTKLLPPRWNFHDRLIKSYVKWDASAKYWQGNPPRECLEAALNPAILHFWGPKKPWKVSHRPYRKLYHAAMRAVGETPPREPLLAPYYNLINALNLLRIGKRVASNGEAVARDDGVKGVLKIFCVYFDSRPVWKSDCVEPIQAGKSRTGVELGMLADDTGDSISAENVRYGEMTAWYWVWKNYLPIHPELTHVGFSHYRRFLDFTGFCRGGTRRTTYRRFKRIFDRHYNARELLAKIGEADLVMRGPEDSGFRTLREQYLDSHPKNIDDFDRFVLLLNERHPECATEIEGVLNAGKLAMELQFVMTRELFSDFMDWVFSLCREFERRWSWSGPAAGAQARAPAFLIERIFLVWLAIKRKERLLKVKELPLVKLTGRPWWHLLLKPVLPFLSVEANDRIYARFK